MKVAEEVKYSQFNHFFFFFELLISPLDITIESYLGGFICVPTKNEPMIS